MHGLESFASILAISGRERLKQVPVRVLLAGIMAWALHLADMDRWIPVWLGVAVFVQLFELWSMTPFRRGAQARPWSVVLAFASTTLMATAYSGAALVIWSSGIALATVAILTIAGGLLTNVASGIGSRALFFFGATPYLVVLALTPLLRVRADDAGQLALMSLTVLLFAAAILNVFWRVHASRRAETGALAEAEHRLEQAQAAMADRAAMAAIVSHELRTPVSAILAGAHVIRTAMTPDKTPETADLIIDAGRLMTGMLNDLLDHSKMEAGAMTLEARDFELGDFVRGASRFWNAPASEKGLELKAVPPQGEPLWLRGDPYRLRQIFNNLVSNAIKFTTRGRIVVRAVVEDAGPERRRLILTVTDQGAGISPEAMARLFSPFAQGSAEVARTYGGTGLGLTVSRDLARLMGGDLTATSVEGQGATFILSVELALGEPVETEDGFEAAPAALARRLRVLAVDDHEINRRTIALVLQPLDIELSTASDGHLALKLLAERPFDAVLMDVNMPGIDGNETTRRLRASGGINADTPVIGFSAGTEAAQVAACHAAGMTDWLAKPLEPKKLYEALQRATTARSVAAA